LHIWCPARAGELPDTIRLSSPPHSRIIGQRGPSAGHAVGLSARASARGPSSAADNRNNLAYLLCAAGYFFVICVLRSVSRREDDTSWRTQTNEICAACPIASGSRIYRRCRRFQQPRNFFEATQSDFGYHFDEWLCCLFALGRHRFCRFGR